jgi:hypothetical protein
VTNGAHEEIEDLLHRRTDLSTFLVHLTAATAAPLPSPAENLVSILHTRTLEARSPYGMLRPHALVDPQTRCDPVVCLLHRNTS